MPPADPATLEVKKVDIRPRKSDITIDRLALIWTPWRVGPDGVATPLSNVEGWPRRSVRRVTNLAGTGRVDPSSHDRVQRSMGISV